GAAWADGHRAGLGSLDALGYRAWWDLPALPKLNLANPQVRAFLLDVAARWIHFGADGWRLDVPEEIADASFWSDLRRRVRSANPEAYLVGEVWHVAPEWVGAGRFDGLMNYPLAWAILGYAGAGRLDPTVTAEHGQLVANLRPLDGAGFGARVLELLAAYHPSGAASHLNLVGSHDLPRVRTVCGEDEAAVRLAMLLLLTLPGAPCIYYGDEVGLAGHGDPDCRGAFPWAEASWNTGLRELVREAIALRTGHPALRGADVALLAARDGACAFQRGNGSGRLVVAVNAGERAANLLVPALAPAGLLATDPDTRRARVEPDPATGLVRLSLPPRTGGVWRPATGD
ncbi:MAG: alpha-amylase family glycosyl hydrolase, partial [Candidatus Limnocylindria bacterium]